MSVVVCSLFLFLSLSLQHLSLPPFPGFPLSINDFIDYVLMTVPRVASSPILSNEFPSFFQERSDNTTWIPSFSVGPVPTTIETIAEGLVCDTLAPGVLNETTPHVETIAAHYKWRNQGSGEKKGE